MSLTYSEENLKKAFADTIAGTNIGAATQGPDALFPKLVKVVVPLDMHDGYPSRLLGSANQICCKDPYGWSIDQREPTVADDTTFEMLYENWFKVIIS
jgi:hypothetical protein